MTRERDQAPEPAVDVTSVRRDAELLDRLAARQPVGGDDVAARLLASLQAEADAGLPPLRPLPWAEVGARSGEELSAGPTPTRWRRAVPLVAVAMAGLLATGGVAAAATGSPLGPLHAVGSLLTRIAGTGLVDGGGEPTRPAVTGRPSGVPTAHATPSHRPLPTQAAAPAQLNRLLVGASAALAHGDLAVARQQMDVAARLAAGMGDVPSSLEQRLRSLTRRLAAAESGSRPTPATKPSHPTGQTHAAAPRSKPSHAHPSQATRSSGKPATG